LLQHCPDPACPDHPSEPERTSSANVARPVGTHSIVIEGLILWCEDD
jgi:hypothetical protein